VDRLASGTAVPGAVVPFGNLKHQLGTSTMATIVHFLKTKSEVEWLDLHFIINKIQLLLNG
jgi:hypothetical protein